MGLEKINKLFRGALRVCLPVLYFTVVSNAKFMPSKFPVPLYVHVVAKCICNTRIKFICIYKKKNVRKIAMLLCSMRSLRDSIELLPNMGAYWPI